MLTAEEYREPANCPQLRTAREGKVRESLPSRNLLDLIALGSYFIIPLHGKSSSEASSAKKR
jgi:hypothetical protein